MKLASFCLVSLSSWAVQAFRPMTTMRAPTHLDALAKDRRDFLVSSVAATGFLAFNNPAIAATDVDYKQVAQDAASLVAKEPDWGPTMVRLAWHSSGTYDKMKKDGGSGRGTIRFKEELAHGGNAGLGDTAVKWLEPIYAKYDGLSYADLYTLAGGKNSC